MGEFSEAGVQGACLSREAVRRTVRQDAGVGAGSLIWEAHSPCLACAFNNILSDTLSNRARPDLKLGGCGGAGWAKSRKFPPDMEGTLRCVSDAGFCFLIANPTLFWEQWNLREALLRGRLESDGKTFSVAGGRAEFYFSGHALISSPFTKHSGQNEMGTNIRQLQGRSGGKPHLV